LGQGEVIDLLKSWGVLPVSIGIRAGTLPVLG